VTQDQFLLRDTVRRLLSAEAPEQADVVLAQWPSRTWTELENAGMTGVGIDETIGGSGGSLLDVATLAFETGRHATLAPLIETSMLCGWVDNLCHWTWSQGVETIAFATSGEIEIRRDGSSLVLIGSVPAVPWARLAQRVLLVLETNDDTVIVRLAPADFTLAPGTNVAGEPRDTIILNAVSLSAEQWQVCPVRAEEIRRRGAFARSVAMVGAMSSILHMTVTFANERQQFGRPIARFQAVQHLLAQLAEEVFASVVITRTALDATLAGGGELETMSAIIRVAKAATKVARFSHQVHGAIGATEEYALHRFTNRLWCWRNEFGGEAAWSRTLSEYVRQAGGPDQLWSLLTGGQGPSAFSTL
jgi:acyl-CoA dehydrogenase